MSGAVASRDVDAGSPVAYREGRALMDSLEAVQRFLRAAARRTANGEGGLAELAALAEIVRDAETAQDEVVRWLLEHDDASLREIGTALGVSRQAVGARYRGVSARQSGGQPSHLR